MRVLVVLGDGGHSVQILRLVELLGPGYEYPIVDILLQGDELTVVTTNWDDSWLEVRSRTGQQGWVVTDLLIVNVDIADVPWNEAWPAPQ